MQYISDSEKSHEICATWKLVERTLAWKCKQRGETFEKSTARKNGPTKVGNVVGEWKDSPGKNGCNKKLDKKCRNMTSTFWTGGGEDGTINSPNGSSRENWSTFHEFWAPNRLHDSPRQCAANRFNGFAMGSYVQRIWRTSWQQEDCNSIKLFDLLPVVRWHQSARTVTRKTTRHHHELWPVVQIRICTWELNPTQKETACRMLNHLMHVSWTYRWQMELEKEMEKIRLVENRTLTFECQLLKYYSKQACDAWDMLSCSIDRLAPQVHTLQGQKRCGRYETSSTSEIWSTVAHSISYTQTKQI